jgi:hypothetical protein
MEAASRAMSSKEKIGESSLDKAKEKPKTPSTIEQATENSESTNAAETVAETPLEQTKDVISSDFFSVNESRLGYKGRLTLAIRKALAGLENEASRKSGLSIEKLRGEFLSAQGGRRYRFEELRVRSEFVFSDYRVFLIFFVSLMRRRSGIN